MTPVARINAISGALPPTDVDQDYRHWAQAKLSDPREARLQWLPTGAPTVDAETAQSLMKLIEVLEDNDDVQNVYANFEMSDETLASLTA